MELNIKLEGLTQFFVEGKEGELIKIISEAIQKASNQIKEQVLLEIDRSMKLAAYVDQAPDPEVMKTIIRSIHVKPDNLPYTNIIIEYGDEYAHLYGGKFDKEIISVITDLVDKAIQTWFNSKLATDLFAEMLKVS